MESRRKGTVYGQCRCCSTKGYHKNMSKEYVKSGIRDTYFNMFWECYSLCLSTNEKLSTLICSKCVNRLIDAKSFKTMVLNTEQELLAQLEDKETVFINVPVEVPTQEASTGVKEEEKYDIKVEPVDEDDVDDPEDSDYVPDNMDDNTMEEYLEDNSLDAPGLVFDEKNLIEGEKELLTRLSPGKKKLPTRETLYETCASFVNQLDRLRGKIVSPKMIKKLVEETEATERNIMNAKAQRHEYLNEKRAYLHNASTILQFSNVTPFKSKSRSGYPCFYCRFTCPDLFILREHQKEHKKGDLKRLVSNHGAESFLVYVDVSDLQCLICCEMLPNINEFKSHLTKRHGKIIHQNVTDRVIPFRIDSPNGYECQLCHSAFETFGAIERHMNVHFRNYVCEECGSGFATKYRWKIHQKNSHGEGSVTCEICKKTYATPQKYKSHFDTVHRLIKRFKCPQCTERFTEYFKRQKHMVIAHGVAPLQYKCNVCDKIFDRKYILSRHMKRDHLEERDFECQTCTYKCFSKNELMVHMIKHTGERLFECSVCKKSYARKKTLREHMRIHNNDRRFVCPVCGQAFVQKCSLKGHMKTHHHEYIQ